MEDLQKTSTEGTQTSAEGKTFTQEDENRIVQERLAKEKGKGNDELDRRAAELDKRERKMNAVQKLRDNGLPDYLVEALNMETDESFQKSMEAILKMKGESANATGNVAAGTIIGTGNPIGTVTKGCGDGLRDAFGL